MAEHRIRIAVIDDDASVRRALNRLLRLSTFETTTYASGSEFLQSLYTLTPDCIVLDLHMQGMTGIDVQRHLLRLGLKLPVIVMTGHDNPRAHDECFALGAKAFFSKPIDGQVLISTIERLVHESRLAN
jgi:FixJ family two-component response regulator